MCLTRALILKLKRSLVFTTFLFGFENISLKLLRLSRALSSSVFIFPSMYHLNSRRTFCFETDLVCWFAPSQVLVVLLAFLISAGGLCIAGSMVRPLSILTKPSTPHAGHIRRIRVVLPAKLQVSCGIGYTLCNNDIYVTY